MQCVRVDRTCTKGRFPKKYPAPTNSTVQSTAPATLYLRRHSRYLSAIWATRVSHTMQAVYLRLCNTGIRNIDCAAEALNSDPALAVLFHQCPRV